MLKLDHLTIIAPSLNEGLSYIRETLDVDMPIGGRHIEMGSHNHLLRIGSDVFLEVIAADPAAARPTLPRWFGLDDIHRLRSEWEAGRRLRGWVARTNDLDAVLATHPNLGMKRRVSRGDMVWHIGVPPDGSLPEDGLAPSVIQWAQSESPAAVMVDYGMALHQFVLECPNDLEVENLHLLLAVDNGPLIKKAPATRYCAVISTPCGEKILT